MAEKLPEPSEFFRRAVQHGGSICIDCQLCGRTHFATGDSGASWEEGELDGLRVKAQEQPDKYVERAQDYDVCWGYIDGKQAVVDCECNGLSRYERFVWQHRHIILRYLRDRMKANLDDAQRDVAELEEVNVP